MSFEQVLQGFQKIAAEKSAIQLTREQLFDLNARESAKDFERLERERSINKTRQIEAWLKKSAIPKRYYGAKILSASEAQKPIYARMQKYVDNFDKVLEKGSPILMLGAVGTGKTHLACAVANEVIKKGYSALYMTLNEAVLLMTESWKKGGESEIKILRRFCEADLIILDEIGCQRNSDISLSIITAIYDALNRELKPTISLSNLSAEQVCQNLTPRIYDRLTHNGVVFEFVGESLRQSVEF